MRPPPGPLRVEWLGRAPYAQVHARMVALVQARWAGEAPDTLLLCEHPPVFTVGRARGASANLLAPGDTPVVTVERGGDVSFHGPGQLVGYPIVGLPPHRQDVRAWLRHIEDTCISAVGRFGLRGQRDPRNTGVWVDGRKLVAIGVALRRWVSWHGFAINVTIDLDDFRRIHPCGMDSALVTRMSDHLRPAPSMSAVRDATAASFRASLGRWLEQAV